LSLIISVTIAVLVEGQKICNSNFKCKCTKKRYTLRVAHFVTENSY